MNRDALSNPTTPQFIAFNDKLNADIEQAGNILRNRNLPWPSEESAVYNYRKYQARFGGNTTMHDYLTTQFVDEHVCTNQTTLPELVVFTDGSYKESQNASSASGYFGENHELNFAEELQVQTSFSFAGSVML